MVSSPAIDPKFEAFLAERMPVLVSFAQSLQFPEPHRILNEPQLFLPGISAWLARQEVTPADREWLVARLGYFVGEYLVMQYGGMWFVNQTEGTRFPGRYVVGNFARAQSFGRVADPFEVAMAAVEPGAPSLELLVREVQHALDAG